MGGCNALRVGVTKLSLKGGEKPNGSRENIFDVLKGSQRFERWRFDLGDLTSQLQGCNPAVREIFEIFAGKVDAAATLGAIRNN